MVVAAAVVALVALVAMEVVAVSAASQQESRVSRVEVALVTAAMRARVQLVLAGSATATARGLAVGRTVEEALAAGTQAAAAAAATVLQMSR